MEDDKYISEDKSGENEPVGTKGTPLFVLVLIAFFALCFVCSAVGCFLYRMYETLPSHNQLQNVEQSLASKVLDKNGKIIHEFSVEKRFWVSIDKIPDDLQNAVIAIEDRGFYKHWGIDVYRVFGAAVANFASGKRSQGASTLTQQLARNVYLTADKSYIRKIREMLTAVKLERTYTKKEIMELYLNQAYLGAGVYGVQAAAEHYFSKHVSELTLGECAVIAGIIQLPEHHRPDREANIGRITTRRNIILRSMAHAKFISDAAAAETINEPVAANPKVYSPPMAPYFMEMVRRYVAEKYGDELLYNGGLVIKTTLDPVAQDSTEKSVSRQARVLQNRLNRLFLDSSNVDRQLKIPRERFMANFDSIYKAHSAEFSQFPDSVRLRTAQLAVVSIDVSTGAVLTLVGGRNFEESRFNRATQARRQPGSAFKTYVYSAALENGFHPASVVLDQPITLITPDGEWRPENFDRTFSGPMTIRNALARSNNLVAIQVFNRIGGQTVVDHARKMGIRRPMNPVPSLAMGSMEVTVMEIVSSYGIYANNGAHAEAYFVQRITDRNGRVLEENTPTVREGVITPQTAFLMNSMLGTVVCCGTAASIPGLGFRRPAAGKTGTTNDYADTWFIGYTPQIVTGVWAGVDERRSMGRGVTGSVGSIPVWVDAMRALHRDLPIEDFSRPEDIKTEFICSESHLISRNSCPNNRMEFFTRETSIDTCAVHSGSRVAPRDGSGMIDLFGPASPQRRPAEEPARQRSLMF
ncbi:MAG: PBP1A family penicillin-binding protein [Chitinispirillia bacterium]|nr:PBP1A family penicillin-binding protein [Chitinispirillia bacterium]